MEAKLVVFVIAAACVSCGVRHQTTTSPFEAHFREQLFVSDAPGAAPLDVAEAIVRLQLWQRPSRSTAEKRLEARSRRALADQRTPSESAETALFDNHTTTLTPYGSSNLSLPPLLLLPLSIAGSKGDTYVILLNILFDCALVLSLLEVMKAVPRIENSLKGDKCGEANNHHTHSKWLALLYFFNPLLMMFPLSLLPRSLFILPMILAVAAAASASTLVRAFAPVALACSLYVMPLTGALMLGPIGHLLQFKGRFAGNLLHKAHGDPQTEYKEPPHLENSNKQNQPMRKDCDCWQCNMAPEDAIWRSVQRIGALSCFVVLWLIVLHGASFYAMGHSWEYVLTCIADYLTIQDMRPNVGVFWYALQQIFDRFRPMFLVYFHGHVLIHASALYTRMFSLPVTYCVASLASVILFQPYPRILDFVTLLCLLMLRWKAVENQKSFIFLVAIASFPLVMIPVQCSLWLRRDTGNANFVYFMEMLHHGASGCLVVEWIRSTLTMPRAEAVQ